jgi:plasmid stability protein
MANLTISIDDDLLRRARIRAAERGTSVNAVLRLYLTEWIGKRSARARSVAALVEQSRRAVSARQGRRWTREELHER